MEDAAPAEAPAEEAVEAPPAPPPPPAVEYSESLPFLVKRPQLKGYVGDVGFDPIGFSEILPMDWLREAELKHCRVSMLAFVSFIGIDQMLRGSGREPGDFGFDPVGFIAEGGKKKEEMQMKELANGRLAMFAFGGAVTQAVLTGNSFPWFY